MQKLEISRYFVTGLLVAVVAIPVHFFHCRLMQLMPATNSSYSFLAKRFIPKPDLAKAISLGYERVLADFYWLMFAQYYGDNNSAVQKFRYAPDYLRLIVSLDPHFLRAYWFTAFVMAGEMGTQARREKDTKTAGNYFDESKRILDYGIVQNPDDWNLPYIAGFNQYLFARNYSLAAHYYSLAAKIPGSPPFMKELAENMRLGVAPLVVEARTWSMAYNSSGDRAVKDHALKELQIIWSQIYYTATAAKLETVSQVALTRLKHFEVELLPEESLPPARGVPATNDDLRQLLK